jgi:FkbM family methyltransferase
MRNINRNGIDFLVNDNTENNGFWDINLWEDYNYRIIKEESNNHKIFVHAGGWIGPFTLYAAKLFDSVYCLEPDPDAFDELKNNIIINNYNNVFYDNKAFYNQITQILIGSDFSPLGRSGTSVFQKDKSVLVDTITLKKYYEDNNLPKNTFLMLDVEGAEYLLFDDIDFFKIYQPKILLSIHLSFLNDENFNFFIESLKKLTDLYDIDIESIYNERKEIQFGSQFRELNYLLTIKK